jgi:hypothetical protein
MEKNYLILKRASASRPSGERKEDDYDVVAEFVGRDAANNRDATIITSEV